MILLLNLQVMIFTNDFINQNLNQEKVKAFNKIFVKAKFLIIFKRIKEKSVTFFLYLNVINATRYDSKKSVLIYLTFMLNSFNQLKFSIFLSVEIVFCFRFCIIKFRRKNLIAN